MESFTLRVLLYRTPIPLHMGKKSSLRGKIVDSTALFKGEYISVEVGFLFCNLCKSWFDIWWLLTEWDLRHHVLISLALGYFSSLPLPVSFLFLRPIPFYQGHGCSLSRLIRNWEAASSPDLDLWGFVIFVYLTGTSLVPHFLSTSTYHLSVCLSIGWYRYLAISRAEAFFHLPHKLI